MPATSSIPFPNNSTSFWLTPRLLRKADRLIQFCEACNEEGVPPRRPATADEIAESTGFLATDQSSFVCGANLAADVERTAV